jgi:FKBP-type peptidyl-prolyl cis-trans isomerase
MNRAAAGSPSDPAVVDFDDVYDRYGISRQGLLNDMNQIKIEKTKEVTDKPFCKLHDWTTVHWKGYLDGQLVEDSHSYLEGKPKVFKLGHFEVSKCWDIAIQQIR